MTKILLIEDEKILRENTSELLELHGFICLTAENGKIGLEKVLTEKPDIIICDIMLPHLTGFQIKEALNNLDVHAVIPFIFLSAKIEREDIKRGMDLGADDYITKPFRIADLVLSIKSRLEQSKNIQSPVKEISAVNNCMYLAKQQCNGPLNGIINLSGILNSKQSNPPEFLEKSLLAINKSSIRLYKTFNNVIDMVRLKHYDKPDEEVHSLTDIKSIINQILSERSEHYNYFGDKNINLNCSDLLLCLEEDLEILVFEVIDNMFKFSTSNNIELALNSRVEGSQKWMIFTAVNSLTTPITFGLKDIKPFKQYHQDKKAQHGSGLGLHLVQIITEKYAGSIEINSSNKLLFRISLTFPIN